MYNSTDLSSAKKWNSTNKVPDTCCIVTGDFPDQSGPTDPSCPTKPTTGNSHAHKVWTSGRKNVWSLTGPFDCKSLAESKKRYYVWKYVDK